MKRMLIVVAAVGALGLVVATAGWAVTSAQGGPEAVDTPVHTFLSKVAEKLGVTDEQMTTAVQDAQVEMIDESVAAGRLTEEQATRLKERVAEGAVLFPRPRFDGGPHHRARYLVTEAAAQVLDLTQEQLVEQLKGGQSLAEVAEAQGMNVEDFKAALLAQVRTELDGKVGEGAITQEQADQAFQRIEERIDDIVSAHPGDCPGPRRGGPGGFGPASGEPAVPEPGETPTL